MSLSQGGYFFMLKTIIVTNKVKQIMYSTQTPPFTRELKQPPPFLYQNIISDNQPICKITNRIRKTQQRVCHSLLLCESLRLNGYCSTVGNLSAIKHLELRNDSNLPISNKLPYSSSVFSIISLLLISL